jgi:hypothetical protein
MSEHTPLPWTWGKFDDEIHIVPLRGEVIAKVCFRNSTVGKLPAEANARFIVRAVNAHDDLLAACRQAEILLQKIVLDADTPEEVFKCGSALVAAIAKAEK